MGDIGSFEVQSRELRQEGQEWQTRKRAVQSAHDLASHGIGRGYMFGYLANLAHLGAYHDTFIGDVTDAFADGVQTFDYLSAALTSAANAYDGADSTAAESADHLKGRLPR
jgi:hypothetical protein